MSRLTPLSGRDRESPPGDTRITQRSSTEAHKDGKSCDMSVADHRTPCPVSGSETSVWSEDTGADVSKHTSNTQNNKSVSDTSICISPRKMSSKAYAPTPYSKPMTPASEVEPKGVVVTASESEIALDIPAVAHIPGKMHSYFTPMPYSRSNTSFSPVKWQGPVDVGALKSNDVITTKQQTTCLEDLETNRLSQMSTLNYLNVGKPPVPSASATTSKTSLDKVELITDPKAKLSDRKLESENKKENFESVPATKDHLSSENDIRITNDIKKKEGMRKEQLISMKPCQEPRIPRKQHKTNKNSSKTRTTNQAKQNKPSRTGRAKKYTVKEKPPCEESEMQQLKNVFEAHLKEKEKFDKLIEKRDRDIVEQLREMDEILELINTEQSEVEKAAGEFADTMKTYTNFRDEATRARVNHVEQEISADILYEENEEIKEQVRELYDQVNEIKERRAIGLDGLKKDAEEMKCIADFYRERNDEAEVRIKSKVEEFNQLRAVVVDKGISYVTKRKPVQKSDFGTPFPKARLSLSPPLKVAGLDNSTLQIEISDVENVPPDITTPRCKGPFESDKLSESIINENIAPYGYKNYETETYNAVESYTITETEEHKEQWVDLTGDVLQSAKYPNVFDLKHQGENDFGNEDITSHRNVDLSEAIRQLSATGQVRIPEDLKRKSRIPKPVVQPYGSTSTVGDRYIVSKNNSLAIIENNKYKRDKFVPEDQRHVTKLTMDFLDAETELRRLKKGTGPMIEDRKKSLRNPDIILQYDGKDTVYAFNPNHDKPNICFEEKSKPNRIKRNEVKSKIETGLKNRPNTMAKSKAEKPLHSVSVKNTSFTTHRKDTYQRQNERRKAIAKEKSFVKSKEFELPPLKNSPRVTENANDMPESSKSFGDRTPLPVIKSVSRQRTKETPSLPPIKPKSQTGSDSFPKASKKRETASSSHRFSAQITPISKADGKMQDLSLTVNRTSQHSMKRTRRVTPIVSGRSQSAQNTSDEQNPEAMWISLSPSPPPSNERFRERTGRVHGSPRQTDKKRVSYGRA